MERITITNSDGAEAFIKAQDEGRQLACAVFFASRAALRVAALSTEHFQFSHGAISRNLSSVPIWRCLLNSATMNSEMTDKIISSSVNANATLTSAGSRFRVILTAAAKSAAAAANLTKIAHSNYAINATVAAIKNARDATGGTISFWDMVSRDAELWLEHADQGDGTLSIDVAPLWSDENPLEQKWLDVRQELLDADTPDERGADWSFWIKWYDDILAGNPQNWKMLHQIATTPDIDWEASSREVNDKINGIVEKFQNVKSDQDKVDTLSDRPKVSPLPKVDAGYVAESLQRHAPALPPSLDAITFIIENEIKRLQEKNYQDDLEAEESKRLINVFMSILRATQEMSVHVPLDRKVEEEDTEAAKTLIKVYHELFSSWPRANAPDVVDATCRVGLTAAATGIMVMCGAPVMVAVGIAGLAYGGPRLKDVGKTLKDALKE